VQDTLTLPLLEDVKRVGRSCMRFYEVLTQIIGLLALERRVSYQALKRQFDLDDAYLADLKAEIVDVHRLTVDQDGTMLVWTGGMSLAFTAAPARCSRRAHSGSPGCRWSGSCPRIDSSPTCCPNRHP
jgi:hypothetical protein